MIRDDRQRLTAFAIRAVEAACRDSLKGPVPRTWGLRLALAYLSAEYPGSAKGCRQFWEATNDPVAYATHEKIATTIRSQACTMHYNGICRDVGVRWTVDRGMVFNAAPAEP